MSCSKYQKGAGTSGIRGQLYETKLLSLVFYRAKHDDSVEQFHLATNVKDIIPLDDICFRVKIKGYDKPVAVFIQAKHKENEKQTLSIDLAQYFNSYLKIRQRFKPGNKDVLFEGNFNESECLFVIYTSARDEFSNDSVESSFASKLNDLIDTGGTAKQPYKHKEDVQFLWEIAMRDQITSLAEHVATFTRGRGNYQMMLTDELVLRYHVILAHKVFYLSEIQPGGHRIASYQRDFFNTKEEILMLFKQALYTEVLKKRKLKHSDTQQLLLDFFKEPTDVTRLSKLIETVVTYNNGQLEFFKKSTADFRRQLNQLYVPQSSVNAAIKLAAEEILSSREFEVPAAFGNKDLTIGGNDDKKIEKRLNHLASRIIGLLDGYKSSKIVIIDDSLERGFLQINGGIASAVGNMLVIDENTKLMKITENWESLGDFAKRLYEKLKNKIPNLHEYKFCFKVNNFPKLSFDCSDHEENLVKDFLSKLLFYSNQADENRVEEILKSEIEDDLHNPVNYLRAKTDAMFIKYHDEIQKWWMLPNEAPYLTKESDIFEKAINNIIKDPLLSAINVMYMNKIKYMNYTFTEDAVKSLTLQDQHSSTVIIAKNSVLTAVKVMQYLNNKDYVVLDLEYILNLPTSDRNALHAELTSIHEKKVIIFVCDKTQYLRNEKKTLENIAKAVHNNKTFVITNNMSVEMLKKYFPRTDKIIYDEKNSLIDLNEESRKRILETARVIFQGIEVGLDLIVDEKSMSYVEGDVLDTIMSKETIVVSKLTVNTNYDEIKHLYVDRRVKKAGDDTDIAVKTLYDVVDDVVLVMAEPGMGKSTLLTYLSLKTKEVNPSVWIARINLLEYSREFSKWKEDKIAIDSLETLNLMCQVILREKLGKENKVEMALEEADGVVYLKHCTGDQWTVFELKLFLYFYSRGKLIFLFDGFDEICPHYAKEVIKCLKTISSDPRRHRLWVTSRSYNEVKTILQRELGLSYDMEHLSFREKEKYLELIWKSNLILNEFNKTQLENVHDFLEFMSKSKNHDLQIFELPLHDIYINASCYLINEINSSSIRLWTYTDKYDDKLYVQEKVDIFMKPVYDDNSDKNPLHLFLRADFLINNIKDVSNSSNNWSRDVNTFTFYERYLETKLKKIRFGDKNKMDIYNPDIIILYDKELAEFIAKHKKLAAYAIFNANCDKLFGMKELEEIRETIKFIEKGGEKTGLIYSVANDFPIFIHMTFAEYFAVEYVCHCLKNEKCSKKQISWMYFIFNVMFSTSNLANVRNMFDYKMKIDKTLMNILQNNRQVIFNLIMKQGIVHSEYLGNVHHKDETIEKEYLKTTENGRFWPPADAAMESLHNFMGLFVSILESFLNECNLNEFLEIVNGTRLLPIAGAHECDKLIVCVFEIVRKINKSKFNSVLLQNFYYLSRSRTYDQISSQEIVQLIHKDYLEEYLNTYKKKGPCDPISYYWLFY